MFSTKVKGVNCVECKLFYSEYRGYKVLIIKLCHCNVLSCSQPAIELSYSNYFYVEVNVNIL